MVPLHDLKNTAGAKELYEENHKSQRSDVNRETDNTQKAEDAVEEADETQ